MSRLLIIIDRIISKGLIVQLIFVMGTIAIVIVCYSLITSLMLGDFTNEDDMPIPLRVYYMLIDSSYQREALKENTKYWYYISIISFSGIILMSGILISIFSNIINRRMDRINNGYMSYSNLRNHILILGYSKLTIEILQYETKNKRNAKYSLFDEMPSQGLSQFLFVKNFRSFFQPYKYVIMSNQDVLYIRNYLKSILPDYVFNRILVLRKNPRSYKDLKDITVTRCERIYVVGDSDCENKDAYNIESWNVLRKIFNQEQYWL